MTPPMPAPAVRRDRAVGARPAVLAAERATACDNPA
jgi:hypothetical protein